MKRVKLFEEFESGCLMNTDDVASWTESYIKEDYLGYFASEIENYRLNTEGIEEDFVEEDLTLVEIIKYFASDEVEIDVDEGAFIGNGYKDLIESIGNFAKTRAEKTVNNTIKKMLREEAEKNVDNWINNKKIYQYFDVELPSDIKRADNGGLWNAKIKT